MKANEKKQIMELTDEDLKQVNGGSSKDKILILQQEQVPDLEDVISASFNSDTDENILKNTLPGEIGAKVCMK